MKKILTLLTLLIVVFSCSNDDNSTNEKKSASDSQPSVTKCPIIRELESSPKGEFMLVNMSGDLFNVSLSDREKYRITNINDYKLGQRICNIKDFGEKIPW